MFRSTRLLPASRLLLSILLLLELVAVEAAFHRNLETFSSPGRRRLSNSNKGGSSSTALLSSTTSTSSSASIKFKNFDAMLDAFTGEPVIVYFSSVNCGPCHLQRKELMALRKSNDSNLERLKILAIDTEKWPHVGSRFHIRSLPCLIVVKDKEILLRLEGLTKAEDLAQQMYTTVGLAMGV